MMFCYGQSAKSKMTKYACEVPSIFWRLKKHFDSGIYGEVGDLFVFKMKKSCAFDKACSNQDLFCG